MFESPIDQKIFKQYAFKNKLNFKLIINTVYNESINYNLSTWNKS